MQTFTMIAGTINDKLDALLESIRDLRKEIQTHHSEFAEATARLTSLLLLVIMGSKDPQSRIAQEVSLHP